MASHVVLFTTDGCAFCAHARSLLIKRKVEFEEVDLSDDQGLRAELASVTGLDSFPQLIIDGEPLGGFNELRAADKNGVLASWSAK